MPCATVGAEGTAVNKVPALWSLLSGRQNVWSGGDKYSKSKGTDKWWAAGSGVGATLCGVAKKGYCVKVTRRKAFLSKKQQRDHCDVWHSNSKSAPFRGEINVRKNQSGRPHNTILNLIFIYLCLFNPGFWL